MTLNLSDDLFNEWGTTIPIFPRIIYFVSKSKPVGSRNCQIESLEDTMGSREEFIKKYADADVNGRLEIILKNYPRFMQMVDGYEQCLSIIIRNEREYNRSRKGEDLGVRVQTSRLSNPTERQAISLSD